MLSGHMYIDEDRPPYKILVIQMHKGPTKERWAYWTTGWRAVEIWGIAETESQIEKLKERCQTDVGNITELLRRVDREG